MLNHSPAPNFGAATAPGAEVAEAPRGTPAPRYFLTLEQSSTLYFQPVFPPCMSTLYFHPVFPSTEQLSTLAPSINFLVKPDEKRKYDTLFDQLKPVGGLLPGDKVGFFLRGMA